jgi:hypothetical protein
MNLQENVNRIKQVMGLLSEQQQNIEVKIDGVQPYSKNTDWDMVHAYFGSKRLTDDLEERVSSALTKGDYIVDNVVISTVKQGGTIKTNGTVSLRQASPNENPHKYFTTRGSIGVTTGDTSDPDYYVNRHDTQVSGLEGRLKSYYKSNNVETFGPYEIFISGTTYAYKQSFFAIEGQSSQVNNNNGGNKRITVSGNNLEDLRNNMKAQTNISIDPKTFVVNLNDNKITFLMGDTEVKSLSFLYDDKGQMSSRLVDSKAKNPTMKTALTGKTGNIEWAVVYFS